jgi:uncharacterized damage-inducible protein DinB
MDQETFTLFARYNQNVNEKMAALIQTLNHDEWNQDFKGFFKSVRALCSHLYISDLNWFKRFRAIRDYQGLKSETFTPAYGFKDLLFPSPEEYLTARPKLDQGMIEITSEIRAEDLGKTLKYTNYQGITLEKNFGGALTQAFIHGVHHRGMISLYLELLGRDNDIASLIPLLGP